MDERFWPIVICLTIIFIVLLFLGFLAWHRMMDMALIRQYGPDAFIRLRVCGGGTQDEALARCLALLHEGS